MSHDEDETNRLARLEYERRQEESFHLMLVGGAILLLGTGAIGAWSFWGYLNTGTWPALTLRALLGWSFTSDMIGLQNIVNWLLDLWIGAYTIAVGCLLIFGNTNS
jgi:hypothetical protein